MTVKPSRAVTPSMSTTSLNNCPSIESKGAEETTSTRLSPGKLYSSCAFLYGTVNSTTPVSAPLLLTPNTSRVNKLG